MRSDAEERVNVEVVMHEKGHGWILHELSGHRQAKFNQGDAMDSYQIWKGMYLSILYYGYLLNLTFRLQTNVAVLTILNELATGKHHNKETGEFDFDAFKITYILFP